MPFRSRLWLKRLGFVSPREAEVCAQIVRPRENPTGGGQNLALRDFRAGPMQRGSFVGDHATRVSFGGVV